MSRRCLRIVVLLAFVAGLLAAAWAEDSTFRLVPPEPQRKTVSAQGYAERWVDPDHCRVYLGCQSQNASLSEARAENNTAIAEVLDAVRALKFPGMKMKAPSLSVQIMYSRPRNNELPRIVGFRTTQQFTVLLASKGPKVLSDQAGKVVDTALTHGANMLGQVTFFREDQTTIQRELLGDAIKDALANAKVMAKAAGMEITGVWTMSGYPQYRGGEYQNAQMMQRLAGPMGGMGTGGNTTVLYGQVKISCSANISASMEAPAPHVINAPTTPPTRPEPPMGRPGRY